MILVSSHYGFPRSTTHVVSGGVLAAGVGRRLADVEWGLAGRIALAWAAALWVAGRRDGIGPETV